MQKKSLAVIVGFTKPSRPRNSLATLPRSLKHWASDKVPHARESWFDDIKYVYADLGLSAPTHSTLRRLFGGRVKLIRNVAHLEQIVSRDLNENFGRRVGDALTPGIDFKITDPKAHAAIRKDFPNGSGGCYYRRGSW